MGSGIIQGYDWVFSGNEQSVWHGFATVLPGLKTAEEVINCSSEMTRAVGWTTGKEDIFRFRPFTPNMIDGLTLPEAANITKEQLLKASDQLQAALASFAAAGVNLQAGNALAVQGWAATVNESLPDHDPHRVLGVMKSTYQPISNVACFRLLDRVIGKLGAHYETAGSLNGGREVFMAAKVPFEMKIKDDILVPYLMLYTSHDGSTALEVKYVLTRPVCQNTVAVARSENTYAAAKVKHTAGNVDAQGDLRQFVIDNVKNTIGQKVQQAATTDQTDEQQAALMVQSAMDFLKQQENTFTVLADAEVSAEFVNDYFRAIVPDAIKGFQTRRENKRAALQAIYYGTQPGDSENGGDGMQATRIDRKTGTGTAWRLYNAVTYLDSHLSTSKQTTDKATGEKKGPAEARLSRLLETGEKVLREYALDFLLKGVRSNGQYLKDAIAAQKDAKEQILQAELVSN